MGLKRGAIGNTVRELEGNMLGTKGKIQKTLKEEKSRHVVMVVALLFNVGS
jgi:hypothetical protein